MNERLFVTSISKNTTAGSCDPAAVLVMIAFQNTSPLSRFM